MLSYRRISRSILVYEFFRIKLKHSQPLNIAKRVKIKQLVSMSISQCFFFQSMNRSIHYNPKKLRLIRENIKKTVLKIQHFIFSFINFSLLKNN